ncbi:MAG: ABC transporter ATP-binding protein [Planctomycetes bacterium]|nr:ABC transporter ATP-binding protein [Planctomycetota bacterium]
MLRPASEGALNEPLLVARDLRHAYPDGPPALDGASLALHAGELVSVLGPNGAGKSTLVRALAGVVAARGSIELCGEPIATLTPRRRAQLIALVPQGLRALPELSVERFVLAGRYAHMKRFAPLRREDLRAVASALERLELSELSGRLLHELSGGQRQRALLARALAQEARVLLVDEPTTALDAAQQLAVFELLAALAREGRAVLVVTHEWNLASQFASRLLLLERGRVAASGTPDEVLRAEVLEPLYGSRLLYGRAPAPEGRGERPYVLPWARIARG